ncbi:MAG: endopeptidase La [Clostridia bacterium]|nr:endopeptidase La [Clostridia bacterium]
MDKRTKILSVIPMRAQVVFPDTAVAFDAGRGMSLAAIERADKNDKLVFISKQTNAEKENPNGDDLYAIGTVAQIRQTTRLPGDRFRVYVQGLYRAVAKEFKTEGGVITASVEELVTVRGDYNLEEASFRTAKDLVSDIVQADGKIAKELENALTGITDYDAYINVCAHYLRLKDDVKQKLLEENRIPARFKLFEQCLNDELEITRLEHKIAQTVRKNIDKSQKEYFLREQLKAIHSELGDDVEDGVKLKEKLLAKNLPEAIMQKAEAELARMDKTQPSSPEYTVIRNYLDWIVDLPWSEETTDTEKLSDVEAVLEADHYGLEKIKERVVEYLAVLKLTGELKAPILCLVGPPGVGKTSVAKSIARSLGRKFVRMSLGGLKDEAEIRGHRRTYIGAMPGRIIYEMKNAGCINPVFLLDEVDKISSDLRGDPSSALLEVLDPEQNYTFRDRYLEVEYDLSKVMFIATANSLDTITTPLKDRMEIIELSGYTPQEKEEIAKRYLVPKKRKENGLDEDKLKITDGAISALIDGYTMEAGVRSLERTIGTVCRKAAVRIAKGEEKSITVKKTDLEDFLGGKRFFRDGELLDGIEVGAATGLAWTAVGGTTLTIEVSAMHGKGDIQLTGKLGDVMKESAHAAISYLRAHAEKYGIDEKDFEEKDIHIHIPEGATPKDGPSAGITMATAILSAFTGQPVRKDVAMTGEITLRGKVLPIGGLKEKALAANRLGIRDVIIPEENKKDVEEIPETVRKELNFICVKNVDEVFRSAVTGGNYGN